MSLFLKVIPLKLFFINSTGPGQALQDKIGVLQNAAYQNNPGSSHNEVKIKPFEFLK